MKMYHTPKQFKKLPGIEAGVTLANRKTINTNGRPRGLNLGDNTVAINSEIEQNFQRFTSEVGSTHQDIALADQVHGNNVKVVDQPGFYTNLDGLITKQEGLLLGVKIADCAALLFADNSSGTIAAVHAGWRGAAAGIIQNAIANMLNCGSDMSDTSVFVSPCISVQNFEIGEEVADQFPSIYINRRFGKKPHLDLKSFVKQQLLDGGIKKVNIEMDPRCTVEDNLFYSYRRERQEAGRMLAFIRLNNNSI